MRIKSKTSSSVYEGDLTPMIDMTFQLIAFFMVLINFQQTEQVADVELPISELAQTPEEPVEYPITLNVTSDQTIVFGGRRLSTFDQLKPYLVKEAQVLRFRKKPLSDATVVIRAHKDARTGFVQELVQICQEEGFDTFSLRAKEDVK